MPLRSLEPSAAELAACRALLRTGSRSFALAAGLLPMRMRDAATSLYAFCRVADDAIDACPGDPRVALAELYERLHRAYEGRPHRHPADRALAHVVVARGIPKSLLEALLEGFAWDAERRRYADLGELTAYAARVAGSVGAMMALVMETRAPVALARAIDLGIAMQFTNIARDVGEDARAGRLYLPLDWLAAEGIDVDDFLARPAPGPALARVVRRLLDEAGLLYARADAGIAMLPSRCRPGIRAARRIYAEIGGIVAANGHDSVTRRAVVPLRRKLDLAGRALAGGAAGVDAAAPLLPQAAFLLSGLATARAAPLPSQRWPDRAARVFDLLIRLQARRATAAG